MREAPLGRGPAAHAKRASGRERMLVEWRRRTWSLCVRSSDPGSRAISARPTGRIPRSTTGAPFQGVRAPNFWRVLASCYGTEGQRFESSRARLFTGIRADLSVGQTPKVKWLNISVQGDKAAVLDFLAHFGVG